MWAADFEIAALLEKMTGDAIDELVEQAFASCRGVDGDRSAQIPLIIDPSFQFPRIIRVL